MLKVSKKDIDLAGCVQLQHEVCAAIYTKDEQVRQLTQLVLEETAKMFAQARYDGGETFRAFARWFADVGAKQRIGPEVILQAEAKAIPIRDAIQLGYAMAMSSVGGKLLELGDD